MWNKRCERNCLAHNEGPRVTFDTIPQTVSFFPELFDKPLVFGVNYFGRLATIILAGVPVDRMGGCLSRPKRRVGKRAVSADNPTRRDADDPRPTDERSRLAPAPTRRSGAIGETRIALV